MEDLDYHDAFVYGDDFHECEFETERLEDVEIGGETYRQYKGTCKICQRSESEALMVKYDGSLYLIDGWALPVNQGRGSLAECAKCKNLIWYMPLTIFINEGGDGAVDLCASCFQDIRSLVKGHLGG
tara:strand:+ start:107 stop:487 length:381 start_codon:yes stop_codon:yes gene_type:complete